jgi:hypothetical protein
MAQWLIRVVPCVVIASVAEGIYTRGQFHRWVAAVSATLVVTVILLMAGLVVLFTKRKRLAGRLAVGGLLTLLSTVPAYATGRLLFRRDLMETERYAESFVPELDDIKERMGLYPERIDSLVPGARKVPKLLEGCPHCFYSSDRKTFRLYVDDPGTAGQSYVFESTTRRWESRFVPGVWF